MSPTTDNFIHSLVEMSKAFEELPNVQTELKSANAKIEAVERHAQALEENINRYKAQIEELQQAKRSVEAERDDAELRFLELDEKASKTIHLLAQIRDTAVSADNILTPPRPEPEPKHEPATETGYVADAQQQGQSEPHPTAPSETTQSQNAHSTTAEKAADASTSPEVPKSDANPSNDANTDQFHMGTSTGTVQTAAPSGNGPYAGKRYYDHPTYLTRDAWHTGGGTDADYDWRPGRSVGF